MEMSLPIYIAIVLLFVLLVIVMVKRITRISLGELIMDVLRSIFLP